MQIHRLGPRVERFCLLLLPIALSFTLLSLFISILLLILSFLLPNSMLHLFLLILFFYLSYFVLFLSLLYHVFYISFYSSFPYFSALPPITEFRYKFFFIHCFVSILSSSGRQDTLCPNRIASKESDIFKNCLNSLEYYFFIPFINSHPLPPPFLFCVFIPFLRPRIPPGFTRSSREKRSDEIEVVASNFIQGIALVELGKTNYK